MVYVTCVLRSVTWRALLLTQLLGALLAVYPWLEQWGQPTQVSIGFALLVGSLAALVMMLALFGADEAVRRGWGILQACLVALLWGAVTIAALQWIANQLLHAVARSQELEGIVMNFFNMATYWGMVMMVYLNRESATRLLTRIRGGELARAQAERQLISSGLATVEAQIDPASVSRNLTQVRDLYAQGSPEADLRLDALIADLRDKVAHSARAS